MTSLSNNYMVIHRLKNTKNRSLDEVKRNPFCILSDRGIKYCFYNQIWVYIVLLELAEKMVDSYFAIVPRSKPLARSLDNVRLIAHRGAFNNHKGILENTHKAFRLAREVGCWGLELDVHATADHVLVVNHDPTLERLWGKKEAIAELTFNDLRALVPEIPSLAEVVAEYGKHMHLFIELKSPFQEFEVLAETLGTLEPGTDYHLMTLDSPVLKSLNNFPKHSLLLVAEVFNVKEFCDLSVKESYGGVMGNYLLLNDKRINQLKQAHQRFGVGFVNSRHSLFRELNRGLSWLFTNQAIAVTEYLHHLRTNYAEDR